MHQQNQEFMATIHVTERSGIAREHEPVRTGVPLARGRLYSASDAMLADEQGNAVPAQFSSLATWGDGSIKWLLVDALVSLQGNGRTSLHIVLAAGGAPAEIPS